MPTTYQLIIIVQAAVLLVVLLIDHFLQDGVSGQQIKDTESEGSTVTGLK